MQVFMLQILGNAYKKDNIHIQPVDGRRLL